MNTARTLTLDPATGDVVTLEQLAERTGLRLNCLLKRYADGKRGEALTESIADAKRRAGRVARGSRAKRGNLAASKEPPTPRELADTVLAQPGGRLLSRRFRDFAA